MVAFEEHFWGDNYSGFEALHTNYKQGITATKEFYDFVKERTSAEESYVKALQRIASKCAPASGHIGSFEPCWKFIQCSTEKLAGVHSQVVHNLNDVAKALKDYNDQQKEKQKHMKEEFGSMSELVQNIQTLNSSLTKAKEAYQARCTEADKSRKECISIKEVPNLEKAESKLKKSCEEYKSLIEKRETTRGEFVTKLTETSKKFQAMEEEHLTQILAFLGKYGNCLHSERALIEQIIEEFSKNMDQFQVSSLLEQFVCAKETGKSAPVPIEFEEVALSVPAVDVGALSNKEEQRRKAKKERKTKKKKEKSTVNGSLQNQDDNQTKESIEVDEDGYSIRPTDPENTSLKSGKSRDSFSSGDGSDSDDDEPRKIQVKIKPKEDTKHVDSSIDALKTMSAGLTLSSPGTIQRRLNTGSNLDMASKKLSRSNNALLDLDNVNHSDTASIKSLPSSTSLEAFQPTFFSNMSGGNTSKENSTGDFDNLFNSSAFNSSASISSDWASELNVPNDAPQSTSETRQDDEETPPPLPTKHKSYQKESATLPRSSKVVLPKSPSIETSNNMNESNVDQPVAPPRQKNNPISNQFPALAPPVTSRRNTSSGRLMTSRPQPQVPQQKQAQSSLLDLMDVFAAPTASSLNPTNQSEQKTAATSQSNPALVANLQTSGLASSEAASEANSSTTTTSMRGDQQAPTLTRSATIAAPSSLLQNPATDRPTPIAVAFIETVNAYFKGQDETQLMVKITGDMTVSFPSSIIATLLNSSTPAALTFDINGTSSLEQIFPHKELLQSESHFSGGDTMSYKFNMEALASYLKKQSEQNNASFYNVDIIKYQVRSIGMKSTPLFLRSYWQCETKITNLKIDYEYNPTSMKPSSALSNLSVVAPVDGGVEIMHSKPSATWSGESQRAVWKLPTLSQESDNKGVGSLRARFEVSTGPSKPVPIAVQFSSEGSTISNVNFDLKSPSFKLSLVKKKLTSGKYLAEPITVQSKS